MSSAASRDEALEKCIFSEDDCEALDIDLSGLQTSCSVENVRKARALSYLLIDEKGQLAIPRISYAKELLASNLYSISYGCEERRRRNQKFLSALQTLFENVEVQRVFKRISRPLINRLAEKAIRDTLLLAETETVTDLYAKRAVLVAFLTTLRQSLGSCFATAPSILVQEEEPVLFLSDLEELMGTAKLKRIVAGNEYSVPMCSSWGNGDLQKPLMLRKPLHTSEQKIYRSPILGKIFQFLELVPKDLGGEDLYKAVYKLLDKAILDTQPQEGYLWTTVEEIFKALILQQLNLTRKDVDDFQNRPKEMLTAGLVVSVKAQKGVRVDKDKIIRKYFTTLEEVSRQFKAEADCALLKSWEFTVASFAEVKFALARYNFYSSLGVNWDDVGGIGYVLYDIAKKRVDETNLELEQEKEKFDTINFEIDALNRRLQQASTDSEMQFLKMEFQTRRTEQQHIQEVCEMIAEKANKVSHLHQFLIDEYDHLMREYFQEVYDPDLHDVQAGVFDDSPAGFRLLYKHGRTNPSLWTKVTSLQEYIDALVSFITITEQELLHAPEIKGIETEFTSIITRLANHIRSDEFIESAFARTALAHNVAPIAKPLQNLDKIEKKPWVYTSGGSMNTLVGSYFMLPDPPEEMGRWVECEEELLAYCIDTTRQVLNRSRKASIPAVLMHSPTHAFLLLPNFPPFSEAVSCDAYSYTWIRNMVKDPYKLYYASCTMDNAAVAQFCKTLSEKLPESIRKRFLNEVPLIPDFLRPFDVGREIVHLFEQDSVLRYQVGSLSTVGLESMLFELPPYTSQETLYQIVFEIMSSVVPKEAKTKSARSIIAEATSELYRSVDAQELLVIVKTVLMKILNKNTFPKDMLKIVVDVMREKRLLPPMPIIFADSNWVKEYFAFIMSPMTQELELWSVNAYGTKGEPIVHWKMWLNGSRKDRTWGLLVDARQYLRFKEYTSAASRFGADAATRLRLK